VAQSRASLCDLARLTSPYKFGADLACPLLINPRTGVSSLFEPSSPPRHMQARGRLTWSSPWRAVWAFDGGQYSLTEACERGRKFAL